MDEKEEVKIEKEKNTKKKRKINIFLITVIYTILYLVSSKILDLNNLTYLWWIKRLSVVLISLGIILSIIQIIKNTNKEKKVKRVILYIVLIIVLGLSTINNFIYCVFISNVEITDEYYDTRMVKETRQVFKNNYINYYDYMNPFIRSKQERISEQYDDTISLDEYCGTSFYNKQGQIVDDFNGKPYIDLSEFENKYFKNNNTFSEINDLLKEVKELYEFNIIEITRDDNFFRIYFVNEEFDFKINSNTRIENNNIIDEYIKEESEKGNAEYLVEFSNDSITITCVGYTTTKEANDSDLNYTVENGKYHTTVDNKKIEILSIDKACSLAESEAKKEKYQYQEWESDFSARENNRIYSAKLIVEMSEIDRLYLWDENSKSDKYKGQVMWQIRLIDNNDPLTNLYLYIDAQNGDVLGAGFASD